MNILMFSWLFWPHIGGVEKHVAEVGSRLAMRGHRVKLFTVMHEPSLQECEQVDGVEVHRFRKKNPLRFERPRIWKWLFAHRELIRWADVVHCHDFFTLHYWYLPFRMWYWRKPVFLTFHGFEESFPPERKLILLRRWYAATSKGNISVGGYISKWYGTRADFVTYGGVNLPANGSAEPEEGKGAIFVGRVSEDTGIPMYLRAVRDLKVKSNVTLPWVICGDGPLMNTVKEERERYNLDITCAGFVSDPLPLVRQARIVFSSSYLSMLEAMAMRKPVFAVSQNPLKRDYLCMMPKASETISVSDSAEDLLSALRTYLDGPLRFRPRVESAYEFAASQTWDHVADLYEQLYSKS